MTVVEEVQQPSRVPPTNWALGLLVLSAPGAGLGAPRGGGAGRAAPRVDAHDGARSSWIRAHETGGAMPEKTTPAATVAPAAHLTIGPALEDWAADARFFEYTRAADPIAAGTTPVVPIERFAPLGDDPGATRILPFDLSGALGADGPATSPALLASFLVIASGDELATAPRATSELYYVLRGAGTSVVDGRVLSWGAGDFFTLPAASPAVHAAQATSVLYWVTDEPLLRYLGVTATERRFRATHFDGARVRAELERVIAEPGAGSRNRLSVLLANVAQAQTLTVTHTLWAMFGVLPAGQVQRPHRHQSVALDLVADCEPGCFSLLGSDVDTRGEIVDPVRVDWEPGGAFVTPPGMWHAHHNESGAAAHIIPIQDAGLQTYLRSLDIRFAPMP
jgi:gentisate 1,2-dioxygenase